MTFDEMLKALEVAKEAFLSRINVGRSDLRTFKIAYPEDQENILKEAASVISSALTQDKNQIEIFRTDNANRYDIEITSSGFAKPILILEVLIYPSIFKKLAELNSTKEKINLGFFFYNGISPTNTITSFEPFHTIPIEGTFSIAVEGN